MPTHVALLRGINVGGRNKVAMADLREIMTSLGHSDVATYIQSGNVVFTPGRRADHTRLAAAIEKAIASTLEVAPAVVVVPRDELARVIGDTPYAAEGDLKKVHAIFLGKEPTKPLVDAVAEAQQRAETKGGRDEAAVVGRVVYVHTPDGYGRSELGALLARSSSPVTKAGGTARNWATVTKLLALCDG